MPPVPSRPPFPRPPLRIRTPFSPGDQSTLDDAEKLKIRNEAQNLKAKLEAELAALEKLRQGEGRPPASSGDVEPPKPVRVTRADSLLPFLLIRSFVGDIGARPVSPTLTGSSPDIIVARPNTGLTYPKNILGRDDMADFRSQNTIIVTKFDTSMRANPSFDIWVHVWNLGRAPAHGVRVLGRVLGSNPPAGPGVTETFVGGRELDLGDRTSSTSHLMVKVGTWCVASYDSIVEIQATAECILDAAANRDGSKDRHSAQTVLLLEWMG
jgi:hypothetical protein